MSATMELVTSDTERAEALAGRLFESLIAFQDLGSVYLGDRLGLYRSLAAAGPATSAQLAVRTGTTERYVREWLEHQAVTGFLEVELDTGAFETRVFRLPEAFEPVLVDKDSPLYMAAAGKAMAGASKPIEDVVDAFRTGAGVPYERFGQTFIEGQAEFNRPAFASFLGSEWLPAMPDVQALLEDKPDARIADIGMGGAWSSIALAKAFPNALVDGFDRTWYSVSQNAAFVAVAKAPAERIYAWAQERGWSQIALVSGYGASYQADYKCQGDSDDMQLPVMLVFTKRDGVIHHFWSTETMMNHVDTVWPYWNLMDFTPEGRPDRETPPQKFRSEFLERNYLGKE